METEKGMREYFDMKNKSVIMPKAEFPRRRRFDGKCGRD
jgi:hypothetical protein